MRVGISDCGNLDYRTIDSFPTLYNTWSVLSPCANNYSKNKTYAERKVGQLQVFVPNDILLFRWFEESRFTVALSDLARPNIWSRFWWSDGLRLRVAAAWSLWSRFRIPLRAWAFVVFVVFCMGATSVKGWPLVHRGTAECVSEIAICESQSKAAKARFWFLCHRNEYLKASQ